MQLICTDIDGELTRLPDLELGLTPDVIGRQEMITPLRHMI